MIPKEEQEDLHKEIMGAVFCGCGEQLIILDEENTLCPACDADECICNSYAQAIAGGKKSWPCPIHDNQGESRD